MAKNDTIFYNGRKWLDQGNGTMIDLSGRQLNPSYIPGNPNFREPTPRQFIRVSNYDATPEQQHSQAEYNRKARQNGREKDYSNPWKMIYKYKDKDYRPYEDIDEEKRQKPYDLSEGLYSDWLQTRDISNHFRRNFKKITPKQQQKQKSVVESNTQQQNKSNNQQNKSNSISKPQSSIQKTVKPLSQSNSMSFNQAFAQARRAGLREFTWRGRRYNTQLAGEKRVNPILEKIKFTIPPIETEISPEDQERLRNARPYKEVIEQDYQGSTFAKSGTKLVPRKNIVQKFKNKFNIFNF